MDKDVNDGSCCSTKNLKISLRPVVNALNIKQKKNPQSDLKLALIGFRLLATLCTSNRLYKIIRTYFDANSKAMST